MEKESLSWTSINQKTKTSDRPFYGKYNYCIKVFVPHCEALRSLDHQQIDHVLQLKEKLYQDVRKKNYGGSWVANTPIIGITDRIRQTIHDACDYFLKCDDVKLNVLPDGIYVYCNEYDMRKDLRDVGFRVEKITKIKINRPKGTVRTHSTEYKIRCYLRAKNLSDRDKTYLFKFLEDNKNYVQASPGLKYYGIRNDQRVRRYHYIDFKSYKLLDILEIMVPNLIRRVKPIHQEG